jgi:hypothetical protein
LILISDLIDVDEEMNLFLEDYHSVTAPGFMTRRLSFSVMRHPKPMSQIDQLASLERRDYRTMQASPQTNWRSSSALPNNKLDNHLREDVGARAQ